jgi:hypothetical protein
MKSWLGHRIRVLLSALALALGMSLAALQGGLMAVEMAVTADGCHHAPSRCSTCGGTDHQDMDGSTCLAFCATVAQGLVPGELLTLPSASRKDFHTARLHLSDQFHSPDHGPPKTLTLG